MFGDHDDEQVAEVNLGVKLNNVCIFPKHKKHISGQISLLKIFLTYMLLKHLKAARVFVFPANKQL